MWCFNCQQDVPASASGNTARCAQCGRFLKPHADEFSTAEETTEGTELELDPIATMPAVALATAGDEISSDVSPTPSVESATDDDDWMLDQQVRQLHRRLHSEESTILSPNFQNEIGNATSESLFRTTDNASATIWPTALQTEVSLNSANSRPTATGHPPSIIAWTMMALGLMAFVCGGMLLAWSFLGRRNDLWNIGMPLTLAGQFGLLLGLVLQLDHLWQANRRTTETLENVDRHLHQMNHAATLLRTSHASPAQSFYAHLAEGAHPHLLMSNLKGRLDLLADKLSQQQ